MTDLYTHDYAVVASKVAAAAAGAVVFYGVRACQRHWPACGRRPGLVAWIVWLVIRFGTFGLLAVRGQSVPSDVSV